MPRLLHHVFVDDYTFISYLTFVSSSLFSLSHIRPLPHNLFFLFGSLSIVIHSLGFCRFQYNLFVFSTRASGLYNSNNIFYSTRTFGLTNVMACGLEGREVELYYS